jgi:tetrapyrrole methylase family protein/MazG family protein
MSRNEWTKKEKFSFEDLVEIVSILRAPDGCPWDREQTHRSLRNNIVEEAYEVCEGIDTNNPDLLREELGDVLLQVVFHAGIAQDNGNFSTEDVIGEVCKKMIRRHPHVFGDEIIDPQKLQESWDAIKKKEKGEMSIEDTLARVCASLPALKRAEKFIEKGAIEPDETPDEVTGMGKMLYRLCKEAVKEEIDPEEALGKYLKLINKKCTNCE